MTNFINELNCAVILKNKLIVTDIKIFLINKSILKNFEDAKLPEEYLEQLIKRIYNKIGINSLNEFKKYLELNKIEYKNVVNKVEIEALWNELIVAKFSSQIKIDKEKLLLNIKKNQNKAYKSYLMSEIFFEANDNSDLKKKFNEIKLTIIDKGFDNAALKYSSSETASTGGKLDWINENSLNKTIRKSIDNLEINKFTKPIVLPGGFLILRINDIKNTKVEIDVEKELIKLKNYERNNQLSQYSKIYYNKIKKNLEISEL